MGIIIYNKNIQKKLNIAIEDYKTFCKKYKEGTLNGLEFKFLKETKRLVFAENYKNNKKMEIEKNFF